GCELSISPAIPMAASRLTYRCRVWRPTPQTRAARATVWPSRVTVITASYRCSTTLRSTDIGFPS
ncbi:MAG: hypothetical protein ACYDES_13865, partial [Acidimicrobiales bacterium]